MKSLKEIEEEYGVIISPSSNEPIVGLKVLKVFPEEDKVSYCQIEIKFSKDSWWKDFRCCLTKGMALVSEDYPFEGYKPIEEVITDILEVFRKESISTIESGTGTVENILSNFERWGDGAGYIYKGTFGTNESLWSNQNSIITGNDNFPY